MGTEIAVALWHNVVELTVYISQLLDHNKTSTAPSHDHHSLNPHPSVTVLMYEVDSEINFTTHGCPGHEMSIYAPRSNWDKIIFSVRIHERLAEN